MKRTLFLAACLGMLWCGAAIAQQTASIQGTVVEADSNEPLIGANVVVRMTNSLTMVAGAASGSDGGFVIDGLLPGTYDVVARFVGFQDQEMNDVVLAAGEQRTVNFVLEAGLTLNPVVITASRQNEKVLDAPASISVVEAAELEKDPVPSPVMSLRNMTGVDIAQPGVDRYQVTLRGFNEVFVTRTYALVDYRQTVTPSLGINQFSGMPISPIDLAQVEVVRGPGSALYGPGVEQGVIHFITKDALTYPGTTVMIGGGQQTTFQGSIRHAGIVNDKLGYKVVAYYSQAKDWELDPNDEDDAVILNAIAPSRLDEDGNVIGAIEGRDDDTWKAYGTATLQYRFSPSTTLTAMGGYSAIKQINQANTGENQIDNFGNMFGQVRLQSGSLFLQAYLNKNDAGDTFVYRSGAAIVDESTQFTGQGQYDLTLLDGRQSFIIGADYKVTTPKTKGTIHGLNEDLDQLTEIGAYIQSDTRLSDQFDLVLTGRIDRDDVIEKVQFSPRVGLVFKPDARNSFRATYNRAFTTPAGVNLFLDLLVSPPSSNSGLFGVRGRGAWQPFTFSPNTLVSLTPPLAGALSQLGVPSRVPLGQLPLAGLYGYGLGIANATGTLDQVLSQLGITGTQALQVKGALSAAALKIPGVVGGSLISTSGQSVQAVSTPSIEQTITNTFEVGYKGLIQDQFVVGIDLYYTRKNNFLSGLQIITPLVVGGADAAGQLGAALPGILGADLAALGLNAQQIGGIVETVVTTSATTPYGVVEPEENVQRSAGGAPELMLTYLNFGEVNYYGADVAVEWIPNRKFRVFGNFSWVSDDFFDDEDLDEAGTGRFVSLNAPTNKFRGGFSYNDPSGFSVNVAGRYNKDFQVRSGVYSGEVESYFLLDVGAGYDFSRTMPGLRLDVLAQNVLNEEHREYIGSPQLGRLVTARLTYTVR
ncbi:MAG: TonB-dependent receptor domain-containing protein [Rhodothermales bacterium]